MSLLILISKFLFISVCLIVFYYILFKNKSSFNESRIFLLLIPLISITISVLTIKIPESLLTYYVPQNTIQYFENVRDSNNEEIEKDNFIPVLEEKILSEQTVKEVPTKARQGSHTDPKIIKPSFDYLFLIKIIYFTVVALYILLLLYHFYKIYLIRLKSPYQWEDSLRIYNSSHIQGSFSFMKDIFLCKDLDSDKRSIIIAHERLHILHHHCIDMALVELMTVTFWFNPVIWLIRREIRLTHEFQVDDNILRNGIEQEKYMKTILEETAGFLPVMANGFNTSLIKKRFMKMKNGNHIRHKKLRLALMIPFLSLLLAFFCVKPIASAQQTQEIKQLNIQEEKPVEVSHNLQVTEPLIEMPETAPVDEIVSLEEEVIFEEAEMEISQEDIVEINIQEDTMVQSVTGIEEIVEKVQSLPLPTKEEPDWDYRAANLTYSNGKYYNPDGVELSDGNVKSAKRYRSKYLSHKDVNIVPSMNSSTTATLKSIERGKKDTRVTFVIEIYHYSNWLFIDKGTCLIDPNTGDRYMVRDMEGGQEVGIMNVVIGLKGQFVEQTLIFPPLNKSVKIIEYYEPANYVDLPNNGTNDSGSHIKNIVIKDYEVKKGKVIW